MLKKIAKKKNQPTRCSLAKRLPVAAPVRRLTRDVKAVSVVISNLILIAAVIVMGFVALAYANSQSNNYVSQYGKSVSSDIDKLKEVVTFEYAYYNATGFGATNASLRVYIMNAGSIGNVRMENLTTSNSSWHYTWNWVPANLTLRYLNGAAASVLNVGQEGYLTIALSQAANNRLVVGSSYTLKLTTGRGSNFEYTFIA